MTTSSMKYPDHYRTVAELRIQLICEYRLHLRREYGSTELASGVTGSLLHSEANTIVPKKPSMGAISWISLIIAIITAIIWIML